MENLCWISILWFIFLVDSSYILKSPRPRKPSPSPMGPVGRGRGLGVVFVAGVHGFHATFHLVMRRRDVKRKYQTNYNLSLCLWFFALHFRALWNTDHLNLKNYTFTCWMDCFKANCLLFSTGFIANWYLANWFGRLVPVQSIFSQQSPKIQGSWTPWILRKVASLLETKGRADLIPCESQHL